ncbi:hypothetical protein GCM10020367_58770 [Streptomyces sannanensis]|uniref:NocE n=1 Tax=Streptomyces sannanensis TaxID=285536 RepID=A0ABP6SJN6_9ACTN
MAPADRTKVIGPKWRSSADRLWATSNDADGFHVLAAEAKTGYAWRTVATLSEPGFDTDMWIGNACVTGSGRRALVVYAPRTFTNKEDLASRGGFTATVDLVTGRVTKLPVQTSLAYYNPGCGPGETAVVTQEGGASKAATRLLPVDTAAGRLGRPVQLPGQVTSAVPAEGGGWIAADSRRLVRISPKGKRTVLARTNSVPFQLTTDADGGVVFMDRDAKGITTVKRATPAGPDTKVATLARGHTGRVGLSRSADGKVFVTGTPDTVAPRLPATVTHVRGIAKDALISSTGAATVNKVSYPDQPDPRVPVVDPEAAQRVGLTVRMTATGKVAEFGLTPGDGPDSARARAPHPTLASPAPERAGRTSRTALTASASATDPVDADRSCSVPRNDPRNQAMQPTPRQVEWAVDQAVRNALTTTRPADWKGLGMPEYTIQGSGGMSPLKPLDGGGYVPAQIMLGITAQESNMWQAARTAMPGVAGNPLIGNFYGRSIYDDNESNDWEINWAKADCGYGVTQVTDGMRLAGRERPGETAMPYQKQRAVALDYAANVAEGLNILVGKWNQTRAAGLTVNDGNPKYIENWFFAVWAYNSGFYPDKGDGSPWGVGWLNNPVNPRYPADRYAFLDKTYEDARTPQKWPYPEKIMGWAGHPPNLFEAPSKPVPGYRAAWWPGTSTTAPIHRSLVKPPTELFCDESNDCEPGATYKPSAEGLGSEPAGPCAHTDPSSGLYDLKCWYHQPVTWKSDCASACGRELLRFDPGYAQQPDGVSFPPNCSPNGLPMGKTYVIDDVPDPVPVRGPCDAIENSGTFQFSFPSYTHTLPNGGPTVTDHPAKVDLHQLSGGFESHFYFGHSRKPGAEDGKLKITGTWTLDRSLDQWARVLVHLPDHGAHTQQAKYTVNLGNGTTKQRVLQQRVLANQWVPLGVFRFAGVPSVSLSTDTADGVGEDDVAWDAIAIQPLDRKPKHFVVALGDSYSSGEGASELGGVDQQEYYRESNSMGHDPQGQNACHRSPHAWSRKAVLSDWPSMNIGGRADGLDSELDYHLIACSGAQTYNIMPGGLFNTEGQEGRGQFHELSQIDKGFLDENTTLVTLSIGGNDTGFGPIITECAMTLNCPEEDIDGSVPQPRDEIISLREWVPRRITQYVRPSIARNLQEIEKRAPHAKIVLMGYPELMESSECLGIASPAFGEEEIAWLREVAGTLAEGMAGAVADSGLGDKVVFADPRPAFKGRGICGTDAAIHGPVFNLTDGEDPLYNRAPDVNVWGLPISMQSFHPNKAGTTLYAETLNTTLRRLGL